jgi:hypothetical protein
VKLSLVVGYIEGRRHLPVVTTDDFDATTVNHTTVTFEGARETHVNEKSGEPRRHAPDCFPYLMRPSQLLTALTRASLSR